MESASTIRRMLFAQTWREMLEDTGKLDFYQEMVTDLLFDGNSIAGVVTSTGIKVNAKTVVLTNGTFLNG